MSDRRKRVYWVASVAFAALSIAATWFLHFHSPAAAAPQEQDRLAADYTNGVRPLLTKYCHRCHSDKLTEAEINLAKYATLNDVRRGTRTWQKVAEMLDTSQMPPKTAKQPSEDERTKLREWVRSFLKAEAKARAGDPGRVVLRRLNNVEYTNTIRDLTGLPMLTPAREFPSDSAAGEGFTNLGNALVMSPAMVTKYLDAAKGIADHLVLLPDGFRFSPAVTRRDWTEELLAEIRKLYGRYTDSKGASQISLQGVLLDASGGGHLPLERYIEATLAERDAL